MNQLPTQSEVQISIPTKHFPAQQSIFASKAKYVIVSKGRRFGFTRGAANMFIKRALADQFQQGLWVDTVVGNIDRYVERYFLPALRKLPDGSWNWRKQAKILDISDAYIDFRSVDNPENIEGFGYDLAFLNEAGIILKNRYLWENAIRPMFWDNPQCQAFIGGTPKGRGLFYELSQRGQDPEQSRYDYFTFSSFDNPFIDNDELRQEMKDMPQAVIDQEIYARFLEDTGVVFRGVADIANAEPLKPLPDHNYSMGVDLAKLQDWTVVTVYDMANNRQVYQGRWNKLEWPAQRARIAETARHFNDALVTLDATGVGDPIADDLLRAGVQVTPYKFTNESKKQLIEKLATYVELKRIRILNLPETIREFNNFTYDISEQTGRVRYEAPVGMHDDIVISHSLAVWPLIPLYREPTTPAPTLMRRFYESKKEEFDDEASSEFSIEDFGF